MDFDGTAISFSIFYMKRVGVEERIGGELMDRFMGQRSRNVYSVTRNRNGNGLKGEIEIIL